LVTSINDKRTEFQVATSHDTAAGMPRYGHNVNSSAGLEQQNGDLAEVEVDEMLRLVCDVAAEVAANDAVPRRIVLLVELFLDVGSNVLLDVVLLKRLCGTVDSILLHVFRHVGVLDYSFPVRHLAATSTNQS